MLPDHVRSLVLDYHGSFAPSEQDPDHRLALKNV